IENLLGDKRQDARVGKKVVRSSEGRELVASEHADERKLAQSLANIGGIDSGDAIERATAGATIEITAKRRLFAAQLVDLSPEHLVQVLPRPLSVTKSKNHRFAFRDLFRDP